MENYCYCKEDEDCGRYYCSTKDVLENETVLRIEPLCAVVCDSLFLTHCCICTKPVSEPQSCKRCNKAVFCESCEKDSFAVELHEAECQSLQLLFNSEFNLQDTKNLRCLLRFLYMRKLKPEIDDVMSDLQHHLDDMDDATFSQTQATAMQARFLVNANARCSLETSILFLGRLDCNGFTTGVAETATSSSTTVWPSGHSGLFQQYGIAIFPKASYFNHSCTPNCKFVVEFGKSMSLVVKTLTNVSAGEDLTISYIDLHQSTLQRQTMLSSLFYFECNCKRCTEPSKLQLEEERRWSATVCSRRISQQRSTTAIVDSINERLLQCDLILKSPNNNERNLRMALNRYIKPALALCHRHLGPEHTVLCNTYLRCAAIARRLKDSVMQKHMYTLAKSTWKVLENNTSSYWRESISLPEIQNEKFE